MSHTNLKNELLRLETETCLTGVFKRTIGQVAGRQIVLVTCVDNTKGGVGYNPNYHRISGTSYEVVDGDKVEEFKFETHLKSYLKSLIEADIEAAKPQVISSQQSKIAEFIKSVNEEIGSSEIKICMDSGEENYYMLKVNNKFVETGSVKPSRSLVKLIQEKAMEIVGIPAKFDNMNRAFWFN
jgi:hypothetical protein